MSVKERLFFVICAVNLLIVLAYLAVGIWIWPAIMNKKGQTAQKRRSVLIKAAVMTVCPLIGPVYFMGGELLLHVCFRAAVDLEDVIFSKERVKTNERVDEEQILNMVPIEEAIAVSDKESLRNLMMNVIKGDIRDSLASISLALNSKDSETSHYAASVLRDELNAFRMKVYKLSDQVRKWEEEPQETGLLLLEYMNCVLEQEVFTNTEQKVFTQIMDEIGSILYTKSPDFMEVQHYEWLCLRLMQAGDFEGAQRWCSNLKKSFPGELAAYTCFLKLYFSRGDRERFRQVMVELRQADVMIDSETLELIRTFM